MASELKSNIKQNIFISKNYEILELRKKSKILLIKMFYLTFDFNSDGIFVFPRVDLHNKILISSQNSDLEKSASSTARPKLWGHGASSYRPPIGLKMFRRTVPS